MNETENMMECNPSSAEPMERGMEDFNCSAEEYLSDVMKRFCPNCGETVLQNATGRPRKFCSTECCNEWWRKHPKPEHWASARKKTCPVCGKEFLSGREIYRPQTYCSHACANRARKGGGGNG